MNKLDMAHEYMVAWMQSGSSEVIDANELASFFFSVADAMQAEADKREPKGFPKAILTKKPNGECAHFHTTLNRTECFDCGEVLKGTKSSQLDWQPDWSVAPDWANWWIKTSGKCYAWLGDKPEISNIIPHWNIECIKSAIAPSFDYQGDWKQSLRKRPQ